MGHARVAALLAPMRPELRPLIRPLGLRADRSRDDGLLRGACGGTELVAATTGIGTRAASEAAERVLDAAPVDHLVVVGIAGAVAPDVGVGEVVVPEVVLDLASGAEYRPTPLGGIAARGTLATSDALLTDPADVARLARRGVIAIDMESAAIGEVCERRGCPWSVFRAISDRAGDGRTDAAVLALAGPDGSGDLSAVTCFLLSRPWQIGHLFRLGLGMHRATGAAARAAVDALRTL